MPAETNAESGRENRHDQGEIREFRDGDPFAFAACPGLRRGGVDRAENLCILQATFYV